MAVAAIGGLAVTAAVALYLVPLLYTLLFCASGEPAAPALDHAINHKDQ